MGPLRDDEALSRADTVPPASAPDSSAPTTPDEPRLQPAPGPGLMAGEVLGERFRIVRRLGEGGMGVVYEAEDVELGEHVALKTLRPSLAASETTLERFRREIALARKVTHPNVSRLFDLQRHRGADGRSLAFVTMELLPGGTLADRLRTGPMTVEEAAPLAEQFCAGLEAAHAAGIVHRDFKPGNVLLVPASAESPERAVVTDFGLARTARRPADSELSPGVAGTPAYMAPEQIEGGPLSPATDVYAMGLVLYEMVTGVRPFRAGNSISGALMRLSRRPDPPTRHVAGLPAHWERTILRCLEREPARRFARAGEVWRALEGEAVPDSRPPYRRPALVAAVLAVLLAAAVTMPWWRASGRPSPASGAAPAVPARRSVAVLGFENLSRRPDAAWLSTALAEMLSAELSAAQQLRTVPGESVAQMKLELSLNDAATFAPETLKRIHAHVAADLVVLGSYLALPREAGGGLRLDLRIQDASDGETVATITETGTEATLLDLVSKAGGQLRKKLGATPRSEDDVTRLAASRPASTEAARLYAEGLGRLRALDALDARDLLQQALAADPAFPLAHSALAEAWSRLGYDARAREEAQRAFELSGQLVREERLAVEGRYREATREWGLAVEAHRALFAFFPDNAEHGLRLAGAQTAGGRGEDALRTVEALRKLPRPASEDPRIDLAEAEAAAALGDYRRVHAAVRRAVERGTAVGARLLVARARTEEAIALRKLGEHAKAVEAAEESRRIHAELGDRRGVAAALNQVALGLKDRGDLAGAIHMHEEALATSRAIGDQRGIGRTLNLLAGAVVLRGELARARSIWSEALAVAREVGDQQQAAFHLNNLGTVDYERGDLKAARSASEEGLAISRAAGDRALPRALLRNLGNVLAAEGDLEGARRKQEEALAVARELGDKRFVAFALSGRAEVLLARGDRAGARRDHAEALALRDAVGEQLGAAESRTALAMLSIEEGRPQEAEPEAAAAVAVFARASAVHHEAWARAVHGRAWLALGRHAEAGVLIRQAAAAPLEHAHIQTLVDVEAARWEVADNQAAAAVARLEAALLRARKAGLASAQFTLRLALGEARRGLDPAAAARDLLALAREARAAGFENVAAQAARAR